MVLSIAATVTPPVGATILFRPFTPHPKVTKLLSQFAKRLFVSAKPIKVELSAVVGYSTQVHPYFVIGFTLSAISVYSRKKRRGGVIK